jgi:hypothetical protein
MPSEEAQLFDETSTRVIRRALRPFALRRIGKSEYQANKKKTEQIP